MVIRFLEQAVFYLLSEDHIVFYLRLGSDLLWPDGVFLQRADPPTPLQREQMRVRAERLLTLAIPGKLTIIWTPIEYSKVKPLPLAKIRATIFETKDLNELQNHIHETLQPLHNKQINKHLLYLLVDLILAKVLPELVNNGDTKYL